MKQVTIKIDGKDYTFQRYPVFQAFEMREGWLSQNNGQYSNKYAYPVILEHVLVKPKMTLEDFTSIEQLDEVCQMGMFVLLAGEDEIKKYKEQEDKGKQ